MSLRPYRNKAELANTAFQTAICRRNYSIHFSMKFMLLAAFPDYFVQIQTYNLSDYRLTNR